MIRRMLSLAAAFILSTQLWAIVNINTATQKELEALQSIGPVKAQAIIDYRQKNGPFKNIEDITQVKGVGDVALGHIRTEISVGSSGGLASLFRKEPTAAKAGDGTLTRTSAQKTGAHDKNTRALPVKSNPPTSTAKTVALPPLEAKPVQQTAALPSARDVAMTRDKEQIIVKSKNMIQTGGYSGMERSSKELKLERKADKKAADRSRKAARGMKESYKNASVSATGDTVSKKINKYPSSRTIEHATNPL